MLVNYIKVNVKVLFIKLILKLRKTRDTYCEFSLIVTDLFSELGGLWHLPTLILCLPSQLWKFYSSSTILFRIPRTSESNSMYLQATSCVIIRFVIFIV